MKNRISLLVIPVIVTGVVVAFTGCGVMPVARSASVNYENDGTFGQITTVPVKDFETVGLVFANNRFDADNKGQITGEVFTYRELLKEAQKKGGDAIINVVIDKRFENITAGMSTTQREMWYGSALAIKYTTVLTSTTTVTTDNRTTSTTSPVTQGGDTSGGSRGGGLSAESAPPAPQAGGGLFGRR